MAFWVSLAPFVGGSDRFPIHWIGPQGEGFKAAAGDVNADGIGDLVLVSTTGASPTSPQRAIVRSGLNGSLLHTWTPSVPSMWFVEGRPLNPCGDLNLDGFGDIALSISSPIPVPTAVLEIRSGRDASVLAIVPSPPVSNASVIGHAIAGVGDLDGDGWPELLATGNHQLLGCATWGEGVYNFEAPAFTLQHYQASWQCPQGFGSQIGRLDDVDGDGFDDYYIGAWQTYLGGMYNAGWIGLFSGATGALITSLNGTTTNEYLGGSVAALRDVSGDGKPEIAVLRLGAFNHVAVLSLPSFTTLYALPTSVSGEVQALGDADGDGLDDFLVRSSTGASGSPPFSEFITAFSGPTAAPFGQVAQNFEGGALYGWSALGDVNGDGLGDFATSPRALFNPVYGPVATQSLWGGWSWPMTGGAATVHVSRNFDRVGTATVGGAARFQVVAPRRAGRAFQVAFSRDAVFPGLALGPFLFPLATDEVFLATAGAGIGGTLSATGHGTVTVPIPPDPTLRDVTLHASGVVYDPAGPLGIGCVLTRVTFAIE